MESGPIWKGRPTMKSLVFLLEEKSAQNMLECIVPKLIHNSLEDIDVIYIPLNGKQNLEREMIRKIQYWQRPNSQFIIMRDKDSEDYDTLVGRLSNLVRRTGKASDCFICIACHELESFFLGDLEAVERGLGLHGISEMQKKRKFRNPDKLPNAAQELKRITSQRYAKLAGSRAISPYLKLDSTNRSQSFENLLTIIRERAIPVQYPED